jgi:hypothetical protein
MVSVLASDITPESSNLNIIPGFEHGKKPFVPTIKESTRTVAKSGVKMY